MVDYSPPAEQVLPFENLPSEDTPLTAEWLNHVDDVLGDALGVSGRVATLEATSSAEAIRDTMATALVAGTGITVTVDDPGDTITIANSGASYTAENARDDIGTALVAGSGISITVSDVGDTITVAALAEYIRDTMATALVGGSGTSITVDDPGDTITITAQPNYNFIPSDHGYQAWAYDPIQATSSTAMGTAGIIHLIKVKVVTAATITGVAFRITSGGASVANGFVALYDTSGNRLAVSAAITTNWQSAGNKTNAFTGTYAAAAGTYYVAILQGSGTMPTLTRGSTSSSLNEGLAAASYRFATYSSGLSAMPATITMASLLDPTAGYWVALY
jgi:hypothetical protein